MNFNHWTMRPTYRQYERRKLGYRKNQLSGISYMLRQSFFADSFSKFWRNWNPLFSYYLLYYCYLPLQKFLPRFAAVVLTFALSGAVHDLAASLLLMRVTFLFTLTFAFLGLFLNIEEGLGLHIKNSPLFLRPFYHLTVITASYFLAKVVLNYVV